jgi:hypothetical protein
MIFILRLRLFTEMARLSLHQTSDTGRILVLEGCSTFISRDARPIHIVPFAFDRMVLALETSLIAFVDYSFR